eukprot:SAG31_NODE_7202_length_1756_cov_2.165963_2_plen_207_part_00
MRMGWCRTMTCWSLTHHTQAIVSSFDCAQRRIQKNAARKRVLPTCVDCLCVVAPVLSHLDKLRFFSYLLECQCGSAGPKMPARPFMLLLPAWTAAKLTWRQFLWCLGKWKRRGCGEEAGERAPSMSDAAGMTLPQLSADLEHAAEVFYIVPYEKCATAFAGLIIGPFRCASYASFPLLQTSHIAKQQAATVRQVKILLSSNSTCSA